MKLSEIDFESLESYHEISLREIDFTDAESKLSDERKKYLRTTAKEKTGQAAGAGALSSAAKGLYNMMVKQAAVKLLWREKNSSEAENDDEPLSDMEYELSQPGTSQKQSASKGPTPPPPKRHRTDEQKEGDEEREVQLLHVLNSFGDFPAGQLAFSLEELYKATSMPKVVSSSAQLDSDTCSTPSTAVTSTDGFPGEEAAPPQQAAGSSKNYAHRQGILAVQLPAGARNLRLKLKSHEGFVFGTAFSPEIVPAADLEWYKTTTMSLFNSLTPENLFKWGVYEPQPGQYERAKAILETQYISFAQAANFSLVRGHTLEWGSWVGPQPMWAHTLPCDEYVLALKERVTRDVKLFKGKFNQYDVFNEILGMPPKPIKICNLSDTVVPDAFKWAHAADPNAQLCINDFSLIEARNAPRLIKFIKEHIWAHGAPIHCIGIQAHYEHRGINITYQKEKLDLLATLGLDLYISEFSLFTSWKGPNGRPYTDLDEDTQARAMVQLFRLWFSHPAVKGITMWGWWDGTMWVPNAGIYRADKQPKKAALAIQYLLQKEFSTTLELQQPPPVTQFKGFYGTYDYEYTTSGGEVVRGTVHLGRNQAQQSLMEAI